MDIFPQSLTVFLLSLSPDVDIHEEESIERIYYDERPLANNVIILTRSESGESGHLSNYSVNNGTSKKKFGVMNPVCKHNISFVHCISNSPLLTCTSNERIYKFVPEKEKIVYSRFSGIQVSSFPFSPKTDNWVWIGGRQIQYGYMGITFESAENTSLPAWSFNGQQLNNYCELYNGKNPSTLAFLKGDETFLLALGLDSNTGNLNALICDMTSNFPPTIVKSWVIAEINNSLVNFTSTAVLKAAATSVSANATHPLFFTVQSPGSSLLVWYDIQMQGKHALYWYSLFYVFFTDLEECCVPTITLHCLNIYVCVIAGLLLGGKIGSITGHR